MIFPFPIADDQQNALTEKLIKLVMQKEQAVQQREHMEQWITADGKTITARPPESAYGHHFGYPLQCLILHQYFGCGVTQPQLNGWLFGII